MLLFLSHSGTDTDAARDLKRRLLDVPDAQNANLKVWLDVDELAPGVEWQPALEQALNEADAFLVYVGARGVLNWVDREVRHALTRATGPDPITFLPVLANPALDESILPPFVQQFQAVVDPLGDEAALSKLVNAILTGGVGQSVLTNRPFIGLRAMGEAEADRYFGRDAEVIELTRRVQKDRLTAVVADSGAGKSSLVRAGLVPAFRGGACVQGGDLRQAPPRHVVVMRPGADPIQGLRDGVSDAARALGHNAEMRRTLRRSVTANDPGETYYALACDIDHPAPDILLVIDQFEELLTAKSQQEAEAFVKLICALVDNDAKPVRVVLTVRSDYYNLMRRHGALFDRMDADDGAAQMRLKRMSDEGLAEIVHRPLMMAGHNDKDDRNALVEAILRDVTGRPGDIALVQMALYATWRHVQETGDDLMAAYAHVHGVLGALAHQAEATRQGLKPDETAALLPLFARLVRLGDTGGATRRIARLSDLDPDRAALARKLATEDAGRLLMVGEDTVEISHEALLSQWPWLQAQIQSDADNVRALARLGDRTAAWQASGNSALPPENERRIFAALAAAHPDWLSAEERACLNAAQRRASLLRMLVTAAVAVIVILGGAAGVFAVRANQAEVQANAERDKAQQLAVEAEEARNEAIEGQQALRDQTQVLEEETRRADEAAEEARWEAKRATEALEEAAQNAAGGLVALSRIAADRKDWTNAIKLTLAAWPRSGEAGLQLADVVDNLSVALPAYANQTLSARMFSGPQRARFSPDGRFSVYQWEPNTPLLLRNLNNGEMFSVIDTYQHGSTYAFSADGRFFAANSRNGKAVLIPLQHPFKEISLPVQSQYVTAVDFSPDGELLYAAGPDGIIHVFRTDVIGPPVDRFRVRVGDTLWFMRASPKGDTLALLTRGGQLVIYDLETRSNRIAPPEPFIDVNLMEFTADGTALLVYRQMALNNYRTFPESITVLNARDLTEFDTGGDAVREDATIFVALTNTTTTQSGDQTYFANGRSITAVGPPVRGVFPPVERTILLERRARRGLSPSSIKVSPDGKVIAVAEVDKTLSLFDINSGQRFASHDLPFGAIVDMAFRSQTKLSVLSNTGETSTVDLTSKPLISWKVPDGGPYRQMWHSPDWTHFAGRAEDGQIHVHKLPDGEVVARVTPTSENASFSVANNGVAMIEHGRAEAVFYDISGAVPRATPLNSSDGRAPDFANVVRFSDDATVVALAGSARTKGWVIAFDTRTGEQVLSADVYMNGTFSQMVFSADGTAVGVRDGFTTGIASPNDALQWYALGGDGTPLQTAPDAPPTADSQAALDYFTNAPILRVDLLDWVFTPDRSRIAVLKEGNVEVYDTATGAVIARLSDKLGKLTALSYPAPDTLHAVGADGRIGTWDLTHLADGSAFEVACRLLPDHGLENALDEYPIRTDPICDASYSPPLPVWMETARKALQRPE